MEIDASELFRVYPMILTKEYNVVQPQETPKEQRNHYAIALATALEIVKVERKYQDEKIEDLKEQLKEAKGQAEEYRQELKSTETKLIGVLEKVQPTPRKKFLGIF
jgi:chromosome segregation ATPase